MDSELLIHEMLEHPNIVRIQDLVEDEENIYSAMELIESGTLLEKVNLIKK